eukprot:CAMPEP_0168167196 /NCGR_PEP_ID=MMETSP0139_2-20121125/2424_1 /TAXON_ID=44445 /ORGANISM="Pseudo-nitzschia australis, Strain 10249 10 AB" /LENGTH=233 /DNA_ID=CAMNT_0008084429 /DNA_START=11 /DNA_END=712 /DNA_ORIENTATION=-
MATQSNTMLDSIFGTKRDFLCSKGGGLGAVDPRQYHCQQYKCYRYPANMPSLPSCSKENRGDYKNKKAMKTTPSSSGIIPSTHPVKTKKTHTRKVTFISEDRVREIPKLSEYTKDELEDIYLSRDEMNRSHEDCWRLVDLMNNGIEYEDHEKFSKRGLIDLKDDSVERRRKIRDQTYQIVLGVQQFHANNKRAPHCMDIVEVTANLYRKAATQARDDAIEAAWYDAVAVRGKV